MLADIPFPTMFLVWFAASVLGCMAGIYTRELLTRRKRMRELPEPPQGVVVHFEDGTSQALEMRYDGIDGDGVARWVNTVPITRRPTGMTCASLPPHTALILQGPAQEWTW